ncbi:MAG TPA: hypothetical protein VJR89_17220, partial [Polyangiales bacterium]|nr:hypothetical protein [Polyangiales bacterium]
MRVGLILLCVLAACDAGAENEHEHEHEHEHEKPVNDAGVGADGFDWKLPAGFPRPVVPEDNPMSPAKVSLGRHIFYDDR